MSWLETLHGGRAVVPSPGPRSGSSLPRPLPLPKIIAQRGGAAGSRDYPAVGQLPDAAVPFPAIPRLSSDPQSPENKAWVGGLVLGPCHTNRRLSAYGIVCSRKLWYSVQPEALCNTKPTVVGC